MMTPCATQVFTGLLTQAPPPSFIVTNIAPYESGITWMKGGICPSHAV
jgi:hypothetical protein